MRVPYKFFLGLHFALPEVQTTAFRHHVPYVGHLPANRPPAVS